MDAINCASAPASTRSRSAILRCRCAHHHAVSPNFPPFRVRFSDRRIYPSPGSSVNTDPIASNARDPDRARRHLPPGGTGLKVGFGAPGTTIRGMAIGGWSSSRVILTSGGPRSVHLFVEGCLLLSARMPAAPSSFRLESSSRIQPFNGGSGLTIGGAAAAASPKSDFRKPLWHLPSGKERDHSRQPHRHRRHPGLSAWAIRIRESLCANLFSPGATIGGPGPRRRQHHLRKLDRYLAVSRTPSNVYLRATGSVFDVRGRDVPSGTRLASSPLSGRLRQRHRRYCSGRSSTSSRTTRTAASSLYVSNGGSNNFHPRQLDPRQRRPRHRHRPLSAPQLLMISLDADAGPESRCRIFRSFSQSSISGRRGRAARASSASYQQRAFDDL